MILCAHGDLTKELTKPPYIIVSKSTLFNYHFNKILEHVFLTSQSSQLGIEICLAYITYSHGLHMLMYV